MSSIGRLITLSACFFFIVLFACSCSDSPIEAYACKNTDEEQIISILIQYQEAKNHGDVRKLLSVLDDGGLFTFQCGRMVTKAVLKKEFPGFWADVKSGNPVVFPLVHECVNGDYFTTGRLNNPLIEIGDGTAKATVLFTKGVCRIELYFSMLNENDRWLITRTEWGHH
jgi:hypothetical protein